MFKEVIEVVDDQCELDEYFKDKSGEELLDYLAGLYSKSFCNKINKFIKINSIDTIMREQTVVSCIARTDRGDYLIIYNIDEIGLYSVTSYNK